MMVRVFLFQVLLKLQQIFSLKFYISFLGEQEDFLPSARFSDTKQRFKPKENNTVPSETEEDETIRWVEENIASASFAGGLLDDEEELINTKFEISKMQ